MVPSRVKDLLRQVDVGLDDKPLPMVTPQRVIALNSKSEVVIGKCEPVSPPVMLAKTAELELVSSAGQSVTRPLIHS